MRNVIVHVRYGIMGEEHLGGCRGKSLSTPQTVHYILCKAKTRTSRISRAIPPYLPQVGVGLLDEDLGQLVDGAALNAMDRKRK